MHQVTLSICYVINDHLTVMLEETCTDFPLKFFLQVLYFNIYIQFYLWKQFSIQKQVQTTETIMQIHNVTQTIDTFWLNSSFTQALSRKPWFEIKKCFHSVPSFAMIVFGLKFPLKRYRSCGKLTYRNEIIEANAEHWFWRTSLTFVFHHFLHVKCYACEKKLAPFQRRVIQLPAKLDALAG